MRHDGDSILRAVRVSHLVVELTPLVDEIVAPHTAFSGEIASNELIITLATDLDDIDERQTRLHDATYCTNGDKPPRRHFDFDLGSCGGKKFRTRHNGTTKRPSSSLRTHMRGPPKPTGIQPQVLRKILEILGLPSSCEYKSVDIQELKHR